jgi:hypothetical protein
VLLIVHLGRSLDGPDAVGNPSIAAICSSSLATNLVQRAWMGLLAFLGRVVNERDLRTEHVRFSAIG